MSHDQIPTPYDGSSRLFQIGLKPLDLADWIEVDANLVAHLAEKDRLRIAHPDEVFVAEPGTEDAQAEVLALLAEHLPARYPEVYRQEGSAIEIVPAGRRVALDAPGVPPLQIAASLVQEDLILMRRGEPGWRLAAGSLSFPSSWSLREKFGRPIDEVHAPVPGFGAGTRNHELIARMLDHLRPEISVIRWNWSLYGDDRLYHPESAGPDARRFGPEAERVFLRVERQTLRRLPKSLDILFTIRIHIDPLSALEAHPDAARVAATLASQLGELTEEQTAYKGLTAERDKLVARLEKVAAR